MTSTDAAPVNSRIVLRVLSDGEFIVNHSLITSDGGPTAVRFDLWRLASHSRRSPTSESALFSCRPTSYTRRAQWSSVADVHNRGIERQYSIEAGEVEVPVVVKRRVGRPMVDCTQEWPGDQVAGDELA